MKNNLWIVALLAGCLLSACSIGEDDDDMGLSDSEGIFQGAGELFGSYTGSWLGRETVVDNSSNGAGGLATTHLSDVPTALTITGRQMIVSQLPLTWLFGVAVEHDPYAMTFEPMAYTTDNQMTLLTLQAPVMACQLVDDEGPKHLRVIFGDSQAFINRYQGTLTIWLTLHRVYMDDNLLFDFGSSGLALVMQANLGRS